MNIHGYKKKYHAIKRLLIREKKKGGKCHPGKYRRLDAAKVRCMDKIREMGRKGQWCKKCSYALPECKCVNFGFRGGDHV